MHLSQMNFDTPLGTLTAVASEYGLFSLGFQEDNLESRIYRYYPRVSIQKEGSKEGSKGGSKVLRQTEQWLLAFFSKKFNQLPSPPLDLQGSEFSKAVWKSLLPIQAGATQSYGQIAKALGNPKANRAVGRAVGSNPIILIIPCHRIIGSDGSLTGFSAGMDRKVWLLDHEK